MELENGQKYHGFLLQEKEYVEDVQGMVYLFSHEKSGARLLYMQNDDPNKVFSIAFKTPPENDTGVPHILEHSVLCGSKKYGVKDPFNELAKGSLYTFLNAMTYSDKTMYPIASCNEQDFHNMMDVYLDAVFHPNIYQNPAIFMQEGWHYTLEDGKLGISGVVYNEMKGVYSDPESILMSDTAKALFGDTTYGFDSGGAPEHIPELSYEEFLAFHKKYYHPSNSYIFLYGNMDLDRCFAHLDEAYLSAYEPLLELPSIARTPDFQAPKTLYGTYPVEEGSNLKESTYLSYSVKTTLSDDVFYAQAFQILSYILLDTNASPIKRALLDSGICQEAEGWYDSSNWETSFQIIGKNAEKENLEEFCRIIHDTLEQLVENGLPTELTAAALDKMEFILREEDYGNRPKGLVYIASCLKSWLHNGSPFAPLRKLNMFQAVKKAALEDHLFEKMIQKYLLDSNNKVYYALSPEAGKQDREDMAFQADLEALQKKMSAEDLKKIEEDLKSLERFQQQEDSPELLEQIPLLELKDVAKEAEKVVFTQETIGEIPVFFRPMDTNGIVYFRWLFDTDDVSEEELTHLGIAADLMTKLDTAKYTMSDLAAEKDRLFGAFYASNSFYGKDKAHAKSFFTLHGSFLNSKMQEALALMAECLNHTDFKQEDHGKQILQANRIQMENFLLNSGHLTAINQSLEALSAENWGIEKTKGVDYLHFLQKTLEQEKLQSILKNVENILNREAVLSRLQFAVCCSEKEMNQLKDLLPEFLKMVQKGAKVGEKRAFHPQLGMKKAIKVAGKVLYNAEAFGFDAEKFPYSGKMCVLRNVLNQEYLWNKIRVQGGAYGCGCQFNRLNQGYFYSYRDPNLQKTYDIYKNAGDFLDKFSADQREMSKFILGAVNQKDRPKHFSERLEEMLYHHWKGITNEMIQQERNEIIETTCTDIQQYGQLFHQLSEQDLSKCSVGSSVEIQKQKNYFDEMSTLMQ